MAFQSLGWTRYHFYGRNDTSCINLSQTHEIVKLFHTLIEYYFPSALLICENNVQRAEKIWRISATQMKHI